MKGKGSKPMSMSARRIGYIFFEVQCLIKVMNVAEI